MQLFDNLASVGLTTSVLQFIILGGIAIVVVGLFWRYIVVGAGILFCVVVFAMPSSKPTVENASSQSITESKVEETNPRKQEEARIQKEMDLGKPEFLSDCQTYGEYTKQQCEDIWNERTESEKVSYHVNRPKIKKSYFIQVRS
jgi:hypothetical protein